MKWKLRVFSIPVLCLLAFALASAACPGLAEAGSSRVSLNHQPNDSRESSRLNIDDELELDYFGMEVGNHFENEVEQKKNTGLIVSDVVELDTYTFDEPTYRIQEMLDGMWQETLWYQRVPGGLALRRIEAPGYMLDLSEPLLFLKHPMVENDQWTSETTGAFSGMPVRVKMQVKTYAGTPITTRAGTFLAYKASSKLQITASSGKAVMRGTDWFVPYIGEVKSIASGGGAIIKSEMTKFLVGGGTINTPPPVITGADPSSGTYGQKISIAGSYFGSERGATILTIGGVEVTDILSWADDKIECLIPSNAVSGPVSISMGAWKSNENIVLHLSAPPEITGVSPSTGTAGGLISIDGKNFGEKKGKVSIGGIKAKVRKGGWMESSIVCTAPKKLGSGTHGITIETPYGSDTLPDAYSIPAQ